MSAADILRAAEGHLRARALEYETPAGERSIARTVAAFNALSGHAISPSDGWLFLACLKLARGSTGIPKADTYEDAAAYVALLGEETL